MKNINIKNRKATFEYTILDKYTSGIMLLGTEIKSIRNNQVNISNAYCIFLEDELFIKDMHITEYNNASFTNHEPKRRRKLLLNRKELDKILKKVKEKGNSIIPLRLFINEKGRAKIEIALARGKKLFDKRENIKEKDLKRDIERIKKVKK